MPILSIGGIGTNCSSGTGAYPIDVTSIPRKAIWPYVQQWSFGVQRELSHSLVLGLAYVGSKGTHLTAVLQPNSFSPVTSQPDSGIPLITGEAIASAGPFSQSTLSNSHIYRFGGYVSSSSDVGVGVLHFDGSAA